MVIKHMWFSNFSILMAIVFGLLPVAVWAEADGSWNLSNTVIAPYQGVLLVGSLDWAGEKKPLEHPVRIQINGDDLQDQFSLSQKWTYDKERKQLNGVIRLFLKYKKKGGFIFEKPGRYKIDIFLFSGKGKDGNETVADTIFTGNVEVSDPKQVFPTPSEKEMLQLSYLIGNCFEESPEIPMDKNYVSALRDVKSKYGGTLLAKYAQYCETFYGYLEFRKAGYSTGEKKRENGLESYASKFKDLSDDRDLIIFKQDSRYYYAINLCYLKHFKESYEVSEKLIDEYELSDDSRAGKLALELAAHLKKE